MFGWWEPFILFGSLSFWGLLLVFSMFMIAAVENDSGRSATFFFVLFGAIWLMVTPYNPFVWIWNNPFEAVTWIGVYFIGGLIWSFGKWYFYLLRVRDTVRELRAKWAGSAPTVGDFPDFVLRSSEYTEKSYPPSVMHNKSKLLFWATWWPWSAFWTLLNDPIKHLWNVIYSMWGRTLQTITNKVFREFDDK